MTQLALRGSNERAQTPFNLWPDGPSETEARLLMLIDSSILPSVICTPVLQTKDNISGDYIMHCVGELLVVKNIVLPT